MFYNRRIENRRGTNDLNNNYIYYKIFSIIKKLNKILIINYYYVIFLFYIMIILKAIY